MAEGLLYDVTLSDIREAAAALQGRVRVTPVLRFEALDDFSGARVFVKAENLQKTGSFKIRGAFNKLRQLTGEQRARGVVAASAGNHAQGVALAARWLGIRCVVVMPEGAPLTKIVAARGYGAEVVVYGDGFDQAYDKAKQLEEEQGLVFIPAFDDPAVIAGQGTLGLEMLDQVPDAEVLLVPVGGGGLISGVAVAAKAVRPGVRVIGIQPEGVPAAYHSWRKGVPVPLKTGKTIADGLAVKRPRDGTLALMRQWVDDMVLVSDDEIARAILLMLEKGKLLVEGAGAAALAAMVGSRLDLAGRNVIAVASGGNIDINFLARIIDHALVEEGRYVRVVTVVPDRPGGLHRLLGVVQAVQANVISVGHDRLQPGVPLGDTEVMLTLEARDRQHVEQILACLREEGYPVEVL